MEEELNENELEERFYSMLHYVDETQANIIPTQDAAKIIENAPRSTLRRYWRTSGDRDHIAAHYKENNPYQKVNIPKEAPLTKITDKPKPKEEKQKLSSDQLPEHLAIFQSPVPQNIKKTIEIIENDDNAHIVELESSDEDEVIEVALPPKPTITIESSDDEEIPIQIDTPTKGILKLAGQEKTPNTDEREVSASPVPSVVSSVSDEFIRSDCIALNISSKRPDNHSFDFSLHGVEFLNQGTPPRKKKKKKNKESATSTPIVSETMSKPLNTEACFATPKSKSKNKKQKTKSYTVIDKSIPLNADLHDSDSNQSIIDKNQKSYTVTEKSLPNSDVYESDSSETVRNQPQIVTVTDKQKTKPIDTSICLDKHETPNLKRKNSTHELPETVVTTVDLTDNTEEDNILENIVIGNVTGFTESEDYGDELLEIPVETHDVTKYGSTKIPAILYENLDFDNLKGKDKVCKNRRYSLTTLRAEMEKFYNESWGGENFNHREIQKNMSRDKSLWAIDPKDRMPALGRKKTSVICNYCNRPGHRDDTCRLKPPVCFMCGNTGHIEPRCPSKICCNCGSPNYMYSTMCRNCSSWGRLACAECGQNGHPSSHCPDLWRRYHNTIESSSPLEKSHYLKKHYQLFCSGCTRRGHLVHTCRLSLPFSGFPINSPYVHQYRPVYGPIIDTESFRNQQNRQCSKTFQQDSTIYSVTLPNKNDRNKRQSKSPTRHESHINKKKIVFPGTPEVQRNTKSPLSTAHQRKNSPSKDLYDDGDKIKDTEIITSSAASENKGAEVEKAPDFIPIGSSNHDKKGHMIQDNEVSDTSDVVTSARIYFTNDIVDKLKSNEGEQWLKETMEKFNIILQHTDINSFLSIKGKIVDQESFQAALRDWSKPNLESVNPENNLTSPQGLESDLLSQNIPKNRNNVLRKLSKALESLKEDLGDPEQMYKELHYLQNHHTELLKQKLISPKQLSNNRDNMKKMLKKLNMILLGQAGLADGSKHLNELQSLQNKLIKYRRRNITTELRQEIGQHYRCIFTAMPRNDYGDLLQKYQVARTSKPVFKKKKNINLKKMKKFKGLSQISKSLAKETTELPKKEVAAVIENKSPQARGPLVEKYKNKLVFYHRRLMNARPNDSVLKKTRVELVRKLHSRIASLHRNANTSSKALKKMRKVQKQARVFLNNV